MDSSLEDYQKNYLTALAITMVNYLDMDFVKRQRFETMERIN